MPPVSPLSPFHEGYLEKQSPKGFLGASTKTKLWQKRWFCLKNTELSYYKKSGDKHPLGCIPLASVEQLLFDGRKFVFKLGDRTFKLRPCDSKDTQDWREALDATMMLLKQGLGEEILASLPESKDGKWWKTFKGVPKGGDRKESLGSSRDGRVLSVVDEDAPSHQRDGEGGSGRSNGDGADIGAGTSSSRRTPLSPRASRHSSLSDDETTLPGDDEWSECSNKLYATDTAASQSQRTDGSDGDWEELGSRPTPLDDDDEGAAGPWKSKAKGATEQTYLEGYLKKQFIVKSPMKSSLTWHRRWFVLIGHRLYHYRDSHSTHKKGGGIPVESLTRLGLDVRKKVLLLEVPVEGARKEVKLMGETADETMKWLRCIATAHQRAGGALHFDFVEAPTEQTPEAIVSDFDGLNEERRLQQVATITAVLKEATSLPALLKAADGLVQTLVQILSVAGRRSPPREDIARFVIREWNQCIFEAVGPYLRLDQVGRRQNEFLLVPWVQWYEDQLVRVRVGRIFVDTCVRKTAVLSQLDGFVELAKDLVKREEMVIIEKHKRRMLIRNGVMYLFKIQQDPKLEPVLKDAVRLTQVVTVTKPKDKVKYVSIENGGGTGWTIKFETEEVAAQVADLLKNFVKPVVEEDEEDSKPPPIVAAPHESAVEKFDKLSKAEMEDYMQARAIAVFTQQGRSLETLEEVLTGADTFVDEISLICEDLKSATTAEQPYRRDIFNFFTVAYHSRIHDVIANCLKAEVSSGNWRPEDTIKMVTWTEKYKQILEAHETSQLADKRIENLPELQECTLEYITHTSEQLRTRLDNIIAADLASDVARSPDGFLHTPAPVDVFQLLNQQLDIVVGTASQQLIVQTIKNCLPMLLHFQMSLMSHLDAKAMELDYCCAMANNCTSSLQYLDDLQVKLSRVLEPALVEQVDFESVDCGFDEVLQRTLVAVLDNIFTDLGPLLNGLFDKHWYEESHSGRLIGSLSEYYSELCLWLQPSLFRRVSKEIIMRVVIVYVERLLVGNKARKIDANFAERVEEEVTALVDLFAQHHKDAVVKLRLKVLREVTEVIVAEPALVPSYWGTLLGCTDACTPVLEKLLVLRVDLDKSARADLMKACAETKPADVVDEKLAVFGGIVPGAEGATSDGNGLERRGSFLFRLRSDIGTPTPDEPRKPPGVLQRVKSSLKARNKSDRDDIVSCASVASSGASL